MRILWHSGAPWAGTGYSVQTRLFAPRLRDLGHDVEISATWGLMGDTLDWEGIKVYPADDRYGNATLQALCDKTKPDLVITLLDVWVLDPRISQGHQFACWTPVDHDPCPPKVAEFFRRSSARPVAMSRHGEKALQAVGLDPVYVPHGVDTGAFQFGANRTEIRETLGLPVDAFIVGMVANNQGHTPSRKAFPQALQAFAAFRQKHPDALLYLHTEMTGRRGLGPNRGVDLPALCAMFEIPAEAVAFTPQAELELGIPTGFMNGLYNTFDVLLNPSMGEGFGIPIVEAQACGTPVIVSDWTAMPELCGAGWIVGGEPTLHVSPDGCGDSYWLNPFVGDIIEALEQAYEQAGGMREQARAFALAYDADKVTEEFWVPALEALSRPREVAPLPNRQMRRAAKKAGAVA